MPPIVAAFVAPVVVIAFRRCIALPRFGPPLVVQPLEAHAGATAPSRSVGRPVVASALDADSASIQASANSPADRATLAALKAGDEVAFNGLVDQYHAAMQRMALSYVKDAAVAQEVVQEAWIGLLESLDRFEGRSSLKTWLFRILINCARARARRESRTTPFSATFPERDQHAIDPQRFYPRFLPGIGGHWRSPPARWQDEPEHRALAGETRAAVLQSIDALPEQQREVILLRDVAGCTAAEACNALGLTDTNQRVLLHRARSSVRRALERMGEAP